jgi:hypothetical protein
MKKIILLFVLLLLSSSAHTAFACSCEEWETRADIVDGKLPFDGKAFLESYQKSGGAIFIGKVTKIKKIRFPAKDDSWYNREITLSVSKSWIGADSQKIVVYTNESDAFCGYPFKKGESYVIFAHRKPPSLSAETYGDKLSVGWCSYTLLLYRAEHILKGLGEAKVSF